MLTLKVVVQNQNGQQNNRHILYKIYLINRLNRKY